jgi:hypothetical protein
MPSLGIVGIPWSVPPASAGIRPSAGTIFVTRVLDHETEMVENTTSPFAGY